MLKRVLLKEGIPDIILFSCVQKPLSYLVFGNLLTNPVSRGTNFPSLAKAITAIASVTSQEGFPRSPYKIMCIINSVLKIIYRFHNT